MRKAQQTLPPRVTKEDLDTINSRGLDSADIAEIKRKLESLQPYCRDSQVLTDLEQHLQFISGLHQVLASTASSQTPQEATALQITQRVKEYFLQHPGSFNDLFCSDENNIFAKLNEANRFFEEHTKKFVSNREAAVRGWIARRKVKHLRAEKDEKKKQSTFIQRIVRGRRGRKQLALRRQERERARIAASNRIQRQIRAWLRRQRNAAAPASAAVIAAEAQTNATTDRAEAEILCLESALHNPRKTRIRNLIGGVIIGGSVLIVGILFLAHVIPLATAIAGSVVGGMAIGIGIIATAFALYSLGTTLKGPIQQPTVSPYNDTTNSFLDYHKAAANRTVAPPTTLAPPRQHRINQEIITHRVR